MSWVCLYSSLSLSSHLLFYAQGILLQKLKRSVMICISLTWLFGTRMRGDRQEEKKIKCRLLHELQQVLKVWSQETRTNGFEGTESDFSIVSCEHIKKMNDLNCEERSKDAPAVAPETPADACQPLPANTGRYQRLLSPMLPPQRSLSYSFS